MGGRLMIGVAVLAAAGVAAWVGRDTPVVQAAAAQARSSALGQWAVAQWRSLTPQDSSHPANGTTAPLATRNNSTTSATSSLHKCTGDGGTTYTNAACPPGTRRAAVDGAVTVLPAVRAPAPDAPAAAAASGPSKGALADIAGPPLKGSLKDQHIDAMR